MPNSPEIGQLRVPIVADLEPFRRQARTELSRAAEEAGQGAARAIGQGMGRRVAREIAVALDAAEQEFRRREREARESLAVRTIRPAEFKRLGEEAAGEFNDALRQQMNRLSREGLLSPAIMVEMERQMKDGGFEAGEGWIDGLRRSFALREADVRESQARGMMTPDEAAEAGREIAEEWNQAILDEIQKRAEEGTLTDDLFIQLTGELRDVGRKGGEEMAGGIRSEMDQLARWMRGGFAAAVLGSFAVIASQVGRMLRGMARRVRETLELGGDAQVQRHAFEVGAARMGESPGEVLRAMREGVRGTASNLELMQQYNKALRTDLPLTAAAMRDLTEVARRLGDEAGVGAARGLEILIDGVARGRSETLQMLGITTRMTDALREWERETGRSSQALSRQERIQIHLNAVLAEGREKVAKLGEEATDVRTPLAQIGAAWNTLRTAMAAAIADSPAVLDFLEALGGSAEEQADKIQTFANRMGAALDIMIEVGREGARSPIGGLPGMALLPFRAWRAVQQSGPEHLARREIQTETDIAALERRRAANLERIISLELDGADADDQKVQSLQRQNELIDERIALLSREAATRTGPSSDEVEAGKAARSALEDAMREMELAGELGLRNLASASGEIRGSLQELLSVQQQIAEVETQIAAIRAGGLEVPAGAEAYLAHLYELQQVARDVAQELIDRWQRDLPAVVVEMQNSFGRLPDLMIQTEAGVRSVTDAMRDLRGHAEAVAEAERELTRAQIARDPERAARAERRLADAREAMRRAASQMLPALEAAGISQERLNELIERMVELLDEADVKTEALGRDWAKTARTFEAAARGVLSIADAMGVLNSQQRRVIQGAIDIAGGIATGGLGGGIQAVGGLVSLLSAITGDGAARRQEHIRQIDEMIKLRHALEQLRQAVLRDVTAGERETMVERSQRIVDAARDAWIFARQTGQTHTSALAQMTGMSEEEVVEAVRWMEERSGRSLMDDQGVVNWPALLEVLESLPELGLWGDTLEGQLDALDWTLRMLGDDALTAAERIERFLEVLRSAGAESFADEYQRILDEQGPEAAQAWLDTLVEAMAAGDTSMFGAGGIFDGLTPEQARRLVERAYGFIDGPGGLVTGTPETRLAVSITQAQGSELLRIGSTQLYHLAGIHGILASMASLPAPSFGVPDVSPPALPSGGGTTIDVGGITVEVSVGGSVDPTTARETGERIGAGVGDGLTDRIRAAQRGAGVSGTTRVRVEVQ